MKSVTDAEYIQRMHKLPNWVREYISGLQGEIGQLKALELGHAVLKDREWFAVNGPDGAKNEFTLFRLYNDGAASICTIGKGDVLLVGRAKKKEPCSHETR